MTTARIAAIAVGVAIAGPPACASKSTPPQQVVSPVRSQPLEDLIALLPDEDGSVGRAIVRNGFGSTDLAAARSVTTVSADRAPAEVTTMTDASVNAMFGEALSSLPPASQRVTLLFQFESDELTVDSAARVSDVVAWVKAYPAPEVTVVGHTDAAGSARSNFTLALRRAERVRDILVAAGVEASTIEVASRGEAEPAVPASNAVFERRNRRVDVSVR